MACSVDLHDTKFICGCCTVVVLIDSWFSSELIKKLLDSVEFTEADSDGDSDELSLGLLLLLLLTPLLLQVSSIFDFIPKFLFDKLLWNTEMKKLTVLCM